MNGLRSKATRPAFVVSPVAQTDYRVPLAVRLALDAPPEVSAKAPTAAADNAGAADSSGINSGAVSCCCSRDLSVACADSQAAAQQTIGVDALAETSTNPKDRLGLLKSPLRLVPPALVIETAPAMANGAAKYGAYNWRSNAVVLSIYLEATLRHIYAYMDGEERASDSGVKHLAHASACLAIIFDAASLGKLVDDRPLPGASAALLAEQVKT